MLKKKKKKLARTGEVLGDWFPVVAHHDGMLWQASASTLQACGCTVARNLTRCTRLASATKEEKKIIM